MPAYDPTRLHFGPYRAPAFQYGRKVDCESRGEVRIVGMTDAPIPWPVGFVKGGISPVLYGSLVKAVRREAACAVRYWWGVSAWLVWKWRRSLGVTRLNEGDVRLRVAIGKSPVMKGALRAMWAKAQDPVRREKIARAKRGKPQPARVVEAVRNANLGRKLSTATRAKMSAAHRQRGTRPPKAGRAWTAQEDRLVRSLPPSEVVRLTGRTLAAVNSRRSTLGITRRWTRAEDAIVKAHAPAQAALLTGRTIKAVWTRRERLGIDDGNQMRYRR